MAETEEKLYPGIAEITTEFSNRARMELVHFAATFASNDMTIGQVKHLHRLCEALLTLQAAKIEEYILKLEAQKKQPPPTEEPLQVPEYKEAQ